MTICNVNSKFNVEFSFVFFLFNMITFLLIYNPTPSMSHFSFVSTFSFIELNPQFISEFSLIPCKGIFICKTHSALRRVLSS